MKCFYHNDRDANVICKNCNKAICSDCTVNLEGEMYCPDCFSTVIEYQKKYLSKLKIRYIVGGVLAAFFFFGLIGYNPGEAMILGIGLGTFPIGLFAMKNSPNPYVPVSYEGLGKLLLLNIIKMAYCLCVWSSFCYNFNFYLYKNIKYYQKQ